jgi:MoaA/NifB/PqqE/SkfB family radical SAM enzyme
MSFCALPWVHLATDPNGQTKLCCIASGHSGDLSKDSVEDVWNNEYMRETRLKMLNNEPVSACMKCTYQESINGGSKRLRENKNWDVDIPNLIASTADDGTVPKEIKYLDLRFGNTCNLKCVMCGPTSSSLWIKDHNLIFSTLQSPDIKAAMNWDKASLNNTWFKKPSFRDSIYKQIPNLKQVFFAGGEPLMIKENLILVEEILRQGYEDRITLRYSTNGLLITQELIDLWSKFARVIINVSIDACGDHDEFIRYPTNFNEVERGLDLLDNAPDNIEVTFATAVQLLNIKHMPDFVEWAGSHIIKPHLLFSPNYLSVQCLPAKDKKEVHKLFKDGGLHSKEWTDILTFMDNEDKSDLLPSFKEYIAKLDVIRETDANSVFPELSHLI